MFTFPVGFFGESTEDISEFKVILYTGTGSAGLNVTGVGFQPDFIWIKDRDATENNVFTDSVRGTGYELVPSTTAAETTPGQGVTSFNSDGFTVGDGSPYNVSGDKYVAYCWKASNTDSDASHDGEQYSTGLSIIKYTGTGANRTVTHSLGVVPKLIFCKNRDSVYSWVVYSSYTSGTKYLILNGTNAQITASAAFNDTAPTSTVVSLGDSSALNHSGDNCILYAFADITGKVKIDSYTGNGTSTGPEVNCGFQPDYVLVKRADNTSQWLMYDSGRSASNTRVLYLEPNTSDAEAGTTDGFDFNATGFQSKGTFNINTAVYIYMAIKE